MCYPLRSRLGKFLRCSDASPFGLPVPVWVKLYAAPLPRRLAYQGFVYVAVPGMSERGDNKRDGSPRRPSKRNEKCSKERGPRGKEFLEAVSCDSQPGPSTNQLPPTSGDRAQTTNDKIDRHTTFLSGFIEKCSAAKLVASPDFRGFHNVSRSDELPDDESDPMDGLDGVTFPVQ